MAKHPVWGQNSAISASIADAAVAGTLADLAAAQAKIDLLKDKINLILAALDKYGITDSSGS